MDCTRFWIPLRRIFWKLYFHFLFLCGSFTYRKLSSTQMSETAMPLSLSCCKDFLFANPDFLLILQTFSAADASVEWNQFCRAALSALAPIHQGQSCLLVIALLEESMHGFQLLLMSGSRKWKKTGQSLTSKTVGNGRLHYFLSTKSFPFDPLWSVAASAQTGMEGTPAICILMVKMPPTDVNCTAVWHGQQSRDDVGPSAMCVCEGERGGTRPLCEIRSTSWPAHHSLLRK